MKRIYSSILPIAGAVLFSMFISLSSASVDAGEFLVPKNYRTIQEAISAATVTAGNTVKVEPGTYGPFSVPNNVTVTIKGTETARTFLSGGGNGTAVNVIGGGLAGTGMVTIQNFTFINALTGINLSNNTVNNIGTAINIKNNVFQVGTGGTAIAEQASTLTTIANNTFYGNKIALSCDSDISISNNIFSGNATAINDSYPVNLITKITNNAFFENTFSGTTGTNPIAGDPRFVDTAHDPRDFHLKKGSACILRSSATSTTNFDDSASDIGAYGGIDADKIPVRITDLQIKSVSTDTIELGWSPNDCYLMTNGIIDNNPENTSNNPGIYRLYFGTTSGGPWNDVSPSLVSAPTVTYTFPVDSDTLSFFGIDITSAPAAPDLYQPSPRDSALLLTWSAVPGATGYKVYYGISSTDENEPKDAGNTTSYTLSGLTNGPEHPYRVAVTAYTQTTVYFVATETYRDFEPLTSYPSATSNQVSFDVGPKRESGKSNEQISYSEPVVTYPALPNASGRCFIATAAYGNYSAPEVLALRAFRDRYLLTSAAGRMFVQWYYLHGPAAAALLNDHPGYKPLVRAALMPVVGTAIFMTETSMMFKAFVFLVLSIAIAFGFFRRRLSRAGGLH